MLYFLPCPLSYLHLNFAQFNLDVVKLFPSAFMKTFTNLSVFIQKTSGFETLIANGLQGLENRWDNTKSFQ